jgi:hypothetical protein
MGEAIRPRSTGGYRVKPPPPKERSLVGPILGAGCVLILLLSVLSREKVPGTVVTEPPAEAVGRWVTTDSRYVDRGLRIGARDIVLEVGPDQPILRGNIGLVTTWQEGPATVVHVEYDTGEGPMILEMMLEGPDTMRLRNPAEVMWTRVR